MVILCIALLAGTIGAFAGYLLAGRTAGLCITALSISAMAYFLMAPVFSFRVSASGDLAALVLYGTVGLVLARTVPSKTPKAAPAKPVPDARPQRPVETSLAAAIAELSTAEIGVRLRDRGIHVEMGCSGELPCMPVEAVRILSDVVAAALDVPQVQRIFASVGRRPGLARLTVVAHRARPPLGESVTVGRRDEDCEPAEFPGWPRHRRATWFDNGHERIYQVSMGHGA